MFNETQNFETKNHDSTDLPKSTDFLREERTFQNSVSSFHLFCSSILFGVKCDHEEMKLKTNN